MQCVLPRVGVCLRVFKIMFMCAERGCKFTGWNVDVCTEFLTGSTKTCLCACSRVCILPVAVIFCCRYSLEGFHRDSSVPVK